MIPDKVDTWTLLELLEFDTVEGRSLEELQEILTDLSSEGWLPIGEPVYSGGQNPVEVQLIARAKRTQ